MTKTLAKYLGKPAPIILADTPFKLWDVERSVEHDLDEPIIQYVFPQNGLELRCDRDEKVSTIFLYSDKYCGFDESLFDMPFSSSRQEVVGRLGTPSKSGGRISDPVLGEYGPWDRFTRLGHTIHVEYRLDADCIRRITLIRADVVR